MVGEWGYFDNGVPRCGPRPRFKVGDRVRVARIYDVITSPDLLGWEGVVEEIEENPGPQFNYNVKGEGHSAYLNEQMLCLVEEDKK